MNMSHDTDLITKQPLKHWDKLMFHNITQKRKHQASSILLLNIVYKLE